jgi:DegV family protein with EDD domain
MVNQYAIEVVPLCLMMGDQTWLDGVEIDPPGFYGLLKNSSLFPSTSQPNVAAFDEVYKRLSQQVEGIVSIHISNELSGTIQSARGAAANLPDVPIEIVDSRGTSMTLGFPVLVAAKAAAAGADLPTVAGLAQAATERTHIYFVVDTLEFLHRGGRIGAAAKLLGSALNLKPILEIRDGVVQPVTKVRTRGKALARVYDLLEEQLPPDARYQLAVVNVDAVPGAMQVRDDLAARFRPTEEIMLTECSPVIGAHTGPGTIGVAYFLE